MRGPLFAGDSPFTLAERASMALLGFAASFTFLAMGTAFGVFLIWLMR